MYKRQVYRSCPYKCVYCWCQLPFFRARIGRGKYNPVDEARRYLYKSNRTIVVSFTSDPYPPVEEEAGLTRQVLKILSESRNRVLVLTKNPELALRDLDVMLSGEAEFWLGTTITSLGNTSRILEPNTPPPTDRLRALQVAKSRGLRTWLSMEPIIPGATEVEEIVWMTISYVDWYVFGPLNYANQLNLPVKPVEAKKYYATHVPRALVVVESYGKSWHVKKELARQLQSLNHPSLLLRGRLHEH